MNCLNGPLRYNRHMLKFYRQNIKTIIWVVVLSFVAWGVGTLSISTLLSSPYEGSIRGEKITKKEFSSTMRFYDLMTRVKKKEFEAPESEPLTEEQLRALTWQTIILAREAKREHIKVTDEDVKAEIEKLFVVEGHFVLMFYQDWVWKNFKGRSRDFEEILRKYLAVQKMRQKVLAGIPEDKQDSQWLQWLTNTIGSMQLKDYSAKDRVS